MILLLSVCYNFLVYGCGRFLSTDKPHYSFATPLDYAIPLLSWTVCIYLGCYLFWVANYILSISVNSQSAERFLTAHFVGETVCFFAFVFLPCSMVRPEITGSSLFDFLIQLQYRLDQPDNLLPSIHCFASWLCWIGVRGKPQIPQWYQIFSLLFAIAVCVSVLTVKQHVIADAIAGIALAEFSFWIAAYLLQFTKAHFCCKILKYKDGVKL